jgi:hypothetical protein
MERSVEEILFKNKMKRKDPKEEGLLDDENDERASKLNTKCKLDSNSVTPTNGNPKESNTDSFKFDIPKDKLNLKEELLAKFHEMDPWMKSEFFKEVTTPKIKTQKNKLFELQIEDDEYEFTPRRQKSERGLNAKDLAALSSIIHSYAGEENKYSVHDFFLLLKDWLERKI